MKHNTAAFWNSVVNEYLSCRKFEMLSVRTFVMQYNNDEKHIKKINERTLINHLRSPEHIGKYLSN
jgi:hypothetical protein